MARSYPVRNAIISLLSENRLSLITTNRGTLYPSFNSDITDYVIDFDNDIDSISFKALAQETGANVKINGVDLFYNQFSDSYPLEEGTNPFFIVVTAENNITKTYNISVNRFPILQNMITNPLLELTSDLTLAVWVNLPALNVDRYGISKYVVYQMEADRSFTNVPRVTLYFDDATNLTLSATGINMTALTWIHLAATHDSTTGITKIFVNGVLINSVENADKIGVNLKQNTEAIICGGKKLESVICPVKDCRVYNSVLTDTQITSIYHLNLLTPTLTSIYPLSGIVGDIITIEGTNFSRSSTILINGISATATYISPYKLTAIIPSGISETGKVIVTEDGFNLISEDDFTLVVPPLIPTITRITPAGFAGETVTITGTNFSNTAGLNRVYFNDGTLQATILTENNTVITCSVPVGVQIGYIHVYNDWNELAMSPFEFLSLQSNADIVTALNNAADGGTVNIPNGAYLFSSQLTLNKSVNIIGGDETYFVSRFTLQTQNVIRMNSSVANPFRISNIKFQCGTDTPMGSYLYFTNANPQFRIDNCHFYNTGQNSIILKNRTFGVIDHCYFYNAGGNCIQVLYEQDSDLGDYPWNNPEPLGTENNVFVEDCTFIGVSWKFMCPIDGFCGARYVFRHNIVDIKANYPLITAHGSWGYGRGNYSVEFYENSFTGATSYWGIYIRGGRGVIYNNEILGKVDLPIAFGEYRVFNTKAQWATSYPTITPHLNWIDDPDEVAYMAAHPEIAGTALDYCDLVYPCFDQVNNFYVWNNTYKGLPVSPTVRDMGNQRAFIQKDRDYFEFAMPGYVPYTYPHPLTT